MRFIKQGLNEGELTSSRVNTNSMSFKNLIFKEKTSVERTRQIRPNLITLFMKVEYNNLYTFIFLSPALQIFLKKQLHNSGE